MDRWRCLQTPHLPVVFLEENFLNGLHKQGNDQLALLGRAGLVLQIFFPAFENILEAGFSR
jgi:hypothetical protein